MVPLFDHTDVPVNDTEASARFLSEVLGFTFETDGPEDEFLCTELGNGVRLLFYRAERFESRHLAFRVQEGDFNDVVGRLKVRGIEFGNDPEKPGNLLTADPLGGRGRIYFRDRNGHLLEVCA